MAITCFSLPQTLSHTFLYFLDKLFYKTSKSLNMLYHWGANNFNLQAIGVSKKIREIPIGIEKIWLKDSALLQPNYQF